MHTATLYALRFKLTCWDVQILVGSGSALYAACKWTFMHLANFAFSLILIYLFWEFKDSDPQPRTNWPWSRHIWYEDFRSWTQLSVVPFCLFVLNLWNIRKKSRCVGSTNSFGQAIISARTGQLKKKICNTDPYCQCCKLRGTRKIYPRTSSVAVCWEETASCTSF